MNRSFVFVIGAACLTPFAVAAEPDDDFADNSLALFDSESKAGWEGNAYWFRVEHGAMVAGRLDKPIPHNEFLCTLQHYDDFELRLEAKLVGEGRNAGVQLRSRRVAGTTEVAGYQADIGISGGRSVWGALYDESRRRRMLAEPEPGLLEQIVKPDDWNAIRVICEGPRIRIYVNGHQTVDFTESEDDIPGDGVIGLQIHGGKPSEAWYRNLWIRPL